MEDSSVTDISSRFSVGRRSGAGAAVARNESSDRAIDHVAMAPVVPLRAAFALPRRSVTPSCSPGCAVIENWFTRSSLSVGRVKTSARSSFAFAGVAATSPRMLLTVWSRERNVPNLKFHDFAPQLGLRCFFRNIYELWGKFWESSYQYYS